MRQLEGGKKRGICAVLNGIAGKFGAIAKYGQKRDFMLANLLIILLSYFPQ